MTRHLQLAGLFAIAAVAAGCGSAGGDGGHRVSTHAAERTLAATSRGGPNPAAAYPGGPAVVRLIETEFAITPANPGVSGTHDVDFEVTNRGLVTGRRACRARSSSKLQARGRQRRVQRARSSARWIFPDAVFGSSAANSTIRGYL
jgi:hypothetical protein